MRYLCIGGPHDGERHEVLNDRQMILTLTQRQPLGYPRFDPVNPTLADMVSYRSDYIKTQLRGDMETYTVYVYRGVSADTMIRRLIEKYPMSGPPPEITPDMYAALTT